MNTPIRATSYTTTRLNFKGRIKALFGGNVHIKTETTVTPMGKITNVLTVEVGTFPPDWNKQPSAGIGTGPDNPAMNIVE